jgi:toxin ParE1/3/4
MPDRSISITDPAHADLEAIGQYTDQQWGEGRGEAYIESLLDSIELLGSNPEMGHRVSPQQLDLRRVVLRHYVVQYRVLELEIEILRVLHKRSNQFPYLD